MRSGRCCRSSPPPVHGGWRLSGYLNQQHYRVQWLEHPGSGAWEKPARDGVGRERSANVAAAHFGRVPGTTLRAMFLTEGVQYP